jgi:hypothetical protein
VNRSTDIRTVHATSPEGDELVRYDRQGKWYIEPALGKFREPVTISRAVATAIHWHRTNGSIHLDRRGGARFDALVRRQVQP